jgi:hypothetical protein
MSPLVLTMRGAFRAYSPFRHFKSNAKFTSQPKAFHSGVYATRNGCCSAPYQRLGRSLPGGSCRAVEVNTWDWFRRNDDDALRMRLWFPTTDIKETERLSTRRIYLILYPPTKGWHSCANTASLCKTHVPLDDAKWRCHF